MCITPAATKAADSRKADTPMVEQSQDTTTATVTPTAADAPAGTKRCAGYPKYGIEPHFAPVDQFQKAASQKDGLDRTCRPHVAEYTARLKAVKAAEAAGVTVDPLTVVAAAPKARAPKAEKPAKAPRARKAQPVAPDALPQTPAEVGTPEGQQVLADADAAAKAARKAADREAARVRMANLRAAKKAAATANA